MIGKQFLGARHVMLFARAETQFDGAALCVYGDVEFGTEAPARATERFVVDFFFREPAAC